jgi:magnesium-transporting ATPase (P-type)
MHVFPGIGLVMQRDTTDAMLMPPRDSKEPLLTFQTLWSIILRSVLISVATSIAPILSHRANAGAQDTSICFLMTATALLLQSWGWLWDRSVRPRGIRFDSTTLTNKPMIAMTAVGFGCIFAALYWRPLAAVLQTQPLDATDWLVSLAVTGVTFGLSLLLNVFSVNPPAKKDQNQPLGQLPIKP